MLAVGRSALARRPRTLSRIARRSPLSNLGRERIAETPSAVGAAAVATAAGKGCDGAGAELVLLLPAKDVDASTPTTDERPVPESVVRCTFSAADAACWVGNRDGSSTDRLTTGPPACAELVAWPGLGRSTTDRRCTPEVMVVSRSAISSEERRAERTGEGFEAWGVVSVTRRRWTLADISRRTGEQYCNVPGPRQAAHCQIRWGHGRLPTRQCGERGQEAGSGALVNDCAAAHMQY